MSRFARNVDANQGQVVAALRKLGAVVHITSGLGGGFPDLVVLHRGRLLLVEVKDGSKAPSDRKLTPAEQVFHRLFAGHVHIVESVEQALALLGVA